MRKERLCKYCGEKLDENNRCLNCKRKQSVFLQEHPLLTIAMSVLILICICIGVIFNTINNIYKNSDLAEYSQLDDILGGLWENESITVDELIKYYKNNEEEADLNYGDMYLEITGNIENIKEEKNRLKIELEVDNDSKYKVFCYFDKEDNYDTYDELKNYKKGKEITIVGNFERKGNNLNMEYCILGDWQTYYDFDNTFRIDVDLDDLIKDAKEKEKDISIDEKNIMSFDDDILNYGYSYEEILQNISNISQGEVEITDIDEEILQNQTIILTMKINGEETSIKVSDEDLIFDKSLVYKINKVLEGQKSEKLFYCAVRNYNGDLNIINIAYSDENSIEKINKVLEKSNLFISNFEKDQKSTSI